MQEAASRSPGSTAAQALQRLADAQTVQAAGLEEEELMQGKFIQRAGLEDEEMLQGKADPAAAASSVSTGVQSGASPLPADLQAGTEALSGFDLSDVRVHYNSSKPAQLNALAYAQGSDIHLGQGQEQHLAHEAWHTVQQRQGRVSPTGSVGGQPLNDDRSLEREADTMGSKALSAATQRRQKTE